jgi:anti-sigma28 factor (negative regulator of flagellin synthesis)
MMIDKIGGINPLNNLQNTRRTNETSKVSSGSDSISVSEEAQKMSEAYYLKEVAAETPDIRMDLVAQIKEKIKDPSYLNSDTISSAADHVMESYGL